MLTDDQAIDIYRRLFGKAACVDTEDRAGIAADVKAVIAADDEDAAATYLDEQTWGGDHKQHIKDARKLRKLAAEVEAAAAPIGQVCNIDVHPASEIFPLMGGDELQELADNIEKNGQREPVVLWKDGTVLDGRNRMLACELAGVEPKCRVVEEDCDPAQLVLSLNLHRRHLTTSQRAIVAARLKVYYEVEAKERQRSGGREKGSANLREASGKASEKAAEKLTVSPRAVEQAAAVLKSGTPELVQAVSGGKLAVSTAADVATLPREQQRALLEHVDEREVLAASKKIRQGRTAKRRTERIAKIAGQATPLAALPRFPVLLADPPWAFDGSANDAWSVDNHYPTMSTDEICRVAVGERATDDAVLFLWTTSPKLREAFHVLDAWGFTYKTCAIWDKMNPGMGSWFFQRHELLLVATHGNFPAPPPEARPPSVLVQKKGAHSEKPDGMYVIIEKMFPSLPKLELFARGKPRPGWTTWGNQIDISTKDEGEHQQVSQVLHPSLTLGCRVRYWVNVRDDGNLFGKLLSLPNRKGYVRILPENSDREVGVHASKVLLAAGQVNSLHQTVLPPDRSSPCSVAGCEYPHARDASRLPGDEQHALYRKPGQCPAGYRAGPGGAWLKGGAATKARIVVDPNTAKQRVFRNRGDNQTERGK